MTTSLSLAVAFLVGALITVQVGANTRLKEAFGEALPAVIVSSSLGVLILAAVALIGRSSWPSAATLAGVPWWGWLGGALGAVGFTEHAVSVGRVAGCLLLIGGIVLIWRF